VTGVEFSSYSSKVAREKRGINVEQGSLEDCIDQIRIPKSEFDVLTAWDVLEHLTDPMRTLKYFNKALKVGGFLFLETVNLDGRTAKQQGNNWHFYRPPKHLFYFSQETLSRYLNMAGFKLVVKGDFNRDVILIGAKKIHEI
jgi:2-polyprenyl-3-methyl-5-hydroxy-6-metoxy-1,4-benzoquinol methylase